MKKEIQEASNPGMSQATRDAKARRLQQGRKEYLNEKNTSRKNYLKNTAKFDSSNYNPEVSRQTENKSTPIAEKNLTAFNHNSNNPKENNMYKKNFMRMNLKESSGVDFKNRLLEEEYQYQQDPSQSLGSRVKDNLKGNWKKYALGAGAGALGATLGDHFDIGGAGEFNDEMQKAAGEGNYGNTVIDKLQKGMEHLKTGTGESVGTPAAAVASTPTAVAGTPDVASTPTAGPTEDQKTIEKLRGSLKGAQTDANFNRYLRTNDIESKVDDQGILDSFGKDSDPQHNPYLQTSRKVWFGDDDVQTSRMDPRDISNTSAQDARGAIINKDYNDWFDTNQAKTQQFNTHSQSLKDIIAKANADGSVNPSEQQQIIAAMQKAQGSKPDMVYGANDALSGIKDELKQTPPMSADKAQFQKELKGMENMDNLGLIKKGMSAQELTAVDSSMDYARKNGMDFLFNNDVDSQLLHMNNMRNQGALPPQLFPIYNRLQHFAAGQK